jgi:signal transduction histidine kinase
MMTWLATRWAPRLSTALALLVAGAVLGMWAFGFRATREWKRSSLQLVETRAEELAELLVTGLTRDMRGVQATILANRDWAAFPGTSASDTLDQVAAAFARYPYPESFFQWTPTGEGDIVFFNRADRRPAWIPEEAAGYPYPVIIARNPPRADRLAERIKKDIKAGHQYSTFETSLGGDRYQIVARIQYGDGARSTAEVFGYTVNLAWAAESYFPAITRQVARIGALESDVDLAVLDESGSVVTGRSGDQPATLRPFLLLYFDPQTVLLDPPGDLPVRTWNVAVSTARHPALVWATQNADWTLLVGALAAVVLGFSLVLTVHTVRESARLAEMRSDFVSTVTHELKTPIATIRAVGDTLVHGRLTTPSVITDYAQVLVQETKRLTRLVDNLLAYARVTDVTEVYSFEGLAVSELVDDALRGFRYQLAELEFEVHADVPGDLPLIRGDRTALRLALDNVIDNAIRYGGARRWLAIRACVRDTHVVIDIEDHGAGIPADELPNIHRKFVRGRLAIPGGSGLGLAIVSRIVADHGGQMNIQSTPGTGTTASLTLPVFERE